MLILKFQEKKSGINEILQHDKKQHTDFFHDLISYTMYKLGHRWTMLASAHRQRSKLFQPRIGEAVLKYQIKHTIDIILEINRIRPRGKMNKILLMIARATFREGNFLKEYIRFCAQIVTVANFFMQRDQDFYLDSMVYYMGDVYDVFFKQRFTALGGWHILQRYAIRYYMYGE